MKKSSTATIDVHGLLLKAAICYKCGARIYPKTDLETHISRHDPEPEIYRKWAQKPARPWERLL